MLLALVWLLPLLGAVLLFAFGPQLRSWAGPIGSALVGVSFVATCTLWNDATVAGGMHLPLVTWLSGWSFGLSLDKLSLVWTLIITGVGFLIHVYSIGYMDGDRAFARFFAYMNFFIFAMLTLVLSDNVVGLLVGWGLVGLASYFLIGFWFERPSAVAAARKAFVMNVVGDVGIMFAIFLIVSRVGSIAFSDIFTRGVPAFGAHSPELFLVCLGLFIGAAAKSAQVPLHTWLPDAMEGPTPVSALIHAATMVTAGVYLVARFAPLWSSSPDAQELVGVIGALTAIAGAILGCVQWDIKRILAYSTMSQIGYMIMGVGVGAYDAGVMHFLTHAFFKAQLFLGSGIVIHALNNEQDVRKMGGLRKGTPFAFWAMLVGVLAICGVPGFSGFFSKDAVLYGTLSLGHPWLYAVGVITAGITAYYMFRLLFVTFFGRYRGDVDPSALGMRHPELAGTGMSESSGAHPEEEEPHHEHAPAWIMSVPVAVLMPFSVLIGWLDYGGESAPWARFFSGAFPTSAAAATPFSELLSSVLVFVVVVIGFAIAWMRYCAPPARANAVERLRGETIRTPAVLVNAYYFDAAYEMLLVRPAYALGRWFVRVIDPLVIDAGVREAGISSQWLGHLFRSFQTGLVRTYALTMALGVLCFVAYYAFAFGGAR
ncbi:MAG TPA: NADH-quinone oxidoreductase subunit L [Candidatus Baltobacteraceae bacterium]|nr:NADH-quinone oxidoreductase subunit L [Candidatus Baltobacteraceae bacterium]